MKKSLSAKINAPEVLEKQLKQRAMKNEYGIIFISSATEAWQPIEGKLNLTRKLLEIILKYKFPIHCQTKSNLILRDLDLLEKIDKVAILPKDLKNKLKGGVIISFSFSTLDENLAKILEPGALAPKERLETMRKCREDGFLTGICYIPVLPYLSDSEEKLDEMIKTAKEYGVNFVLVGALTFLAINQQIAKLFITNF